VIKRGSDLKLHERLRAHSGSPDGTSSIWLTAVRSAKSLRIVRLIGSGGIDPALYGQDRAGHHRKASMVTSSAFGASPVKASGADCRSGRSPP
jgi:hypothetical protein